jgi:hypothetical protein
MLSVGGAGLATFAVSGALGLHKDNQLDECTPNCSRDEVDTEKTYLLIADIGLVAGLVSTAIGMYLWLSDSRTAPDAQGASSTRLQPWLGNGVAGARTEVKF